VSAQDDAPRLTPHAAGALLGARITVGVRPRTRELTPVRHGPTLALMPRFVSCLPTSPHVVHAKEPVDADFPPFLCDAHRRPSP
jgi:hypothetical protein